MVDFSSCLRRSQQQPGGPRVAAVGLRPPSVVEAPKFLDLIFVTTFAPFPVLLDTNRQQFAETQRVSCHGWSYVNSFWLLQGQEP